MPINKPNLVEKVLKVYSQLQIQFTYIFAAVFSSFGHVPTVISNSLKCLNLLLS